MAYVSLEEYQQLRAENERLHDRIKQLMGPAERYWEARWRDVDAECERLRKGLEKIATFGDDDLARRCAQETLDGGG